MDHQLVNQDYLSNLLVLSREQNDSDLVSHLFQNLQTEYHAFLRDCEPMLESAELRKEFQQRIHRLKNNFFNLGCEEVGSILEEMYQLLKNDSPDTTTMRSLWLRLQNASELTFSHLRKTLAEH